jgi:hypothetical protein
MRDYLACGTGVVILGVLYFLDVENLFLYTGYAFVKALGCFLAVVFSIWGLVLVRRRKLGPGAAAVLISIAFLVSGWSLRAFPATPRKQFCLLAEAIKPNDTMDSVKARLAGYNSWSRQEGYISFNFASGPRTTDVVVIHYDPNTSRVLSSDLSLD